MEREITLTEILDARSRRAERQKALLALYRCPVVSFTMNIAGPVKNGPVIRRAFRAGLDRLENALRGERVSILHREQTDEPTGCEALWVVQAPCEKVKSLCVDVEDADAMGRLFDMDVLDETRHKLDREDLGYPSRGCLICGSPGRSCASRRVHSAEELRAATDRILRDHFAAVDQKLLAAQAARALLYEACAAPKPGLVDRYNNGSHRDMDLFTFLDSTAALLPYLEDAVKIGMETAELPADEAFRVLRRVGVSAEGAMLRATGGVNTHKGAIFTMGCLCAACGRLWTPEGPCRDTGRLLDTVAALTREAMERDYAAMAAADPETAGQRLYRTRGVRGIRGEAENGLPSVRDVGLPMLMKARQAGLTWEQAGTIALLALIAQVQDTNLLARGGVKGQSFAAERAKELLEQEPFPSEYAVELMDREMIRHRLSPGGCADLLAACYFLAFLDDAGPEPAHGSHSEA